MKKVKNRMGSPHMSDVSILVSVEDLINMAMGPPHKNTVNYKMIQTVLHILARQMRLLETRVEIRAEQVKPAKKTTADEGEASTSSESSTSVMDTGEVMSIRGRKVDKDADQGRARADKERKKEVKAALKAEQMTERDAEKARLKTEKAEKSEAKEGDKDERNKSKERKRAEKSEAKERDKAERDKSKEREKAETVTAKEKEKAEGGETKERDKAEKAARKEREKAEKAALKEKEKPLKGEVKERDKADASKERDKTDKVASKEKEKTDKPSSKERASKAEEKGKETTAAASSKEKERGKMEKIENKEKERPEKNYLKENERAAKMDAKEQEKAAADEKRKLEKMSPQEKEKYLKEKAQREAQEASARKKDKKGRVQSGSGITISEVERRKEKVLVVEKGPTTRSDSRSRVGSIEVVTLSQFELLEAAVKRLEEKTAPLPMPAFPENKKLLTELARGSASLTDTMQAMQVSARVRAAEAAIGRMAGLLTQLAAAGALPEDIAEKVEDVKAEMSTIPESVRRLAPDLSRTPPDLAQIPQNEETMKHTPTGVAATKSVAIDPISLKSVESKLMRPSVAVGGRPSVAPSTTSRHSAATMGLGVTHQEMDDTLRQMQEDLKKYVTAVTTKATTSADQASSVARATAEKLDIALSLNDRLATLYSLVNDYAEQLTGFDSGLTTQMLSFQEQIAQMRGDLKGGLVQLEQANNNAETSAVLELTERCETLQIDLTHTLTYHQHLVTFQRQLGDDLRSLIESVEMLREQKADRDEVQDGLRDKADNSKLAGLLTEVYFAEARAELERRLELCYDKFARQDQAWMSVIHDLKLVAEGKAEIMQMLAMREEAQNALRDIQEKLRQLAIQLGEPKAALLTRLLSRDGVCGACKVPALMAPTEPAAGQPPLLPPLLPPLPPPLRPPPDGEPCAPPWCPTPSPRPDDKVHTCHRWVGGSHTLLAPSAPVSREPAPAALPPRPPPARRAAGYGSDGRMYLMEEELLPCVECNKLTTDKLDDDDAEDLLPVKLEDGAGDAVAAPNMQ